MKRIPLIIAVILGVILIVTVYFFMSFDRILKAAIETFGTQIIGTEVALSSAEVSPKSGSGALKNLSIANPKGFSDGSAISFKEISLKLDTGTLGDDTVLVSTIVIDAPHLTYELGKGGSNLDALQRNVDSYMAAHASDKSNAEKADQGPDTKLIIESLVIRNGTVSIKADAMGDEAINAPLPDIHLTNIGKGDGATPGEVTEKIFDSLKEKALLAVASSKLGDMGKTISKGAGAIGESAGEAGKALKGLLGN